MIDFYEIERKRLALEQRKPSLIEAACFFAFYVFILSIICLASRYI